MPHHFTKNTVEASAWCPTCNKFTMHYVYDGRLGRCMNDHHPPKEPEKPVDTQGELFAPMKTSLTVLDNSGKI